jgi:hypothetical protein
LRFIACPHDEFQCFQCFTWGNADFVALTLRSVIPTLLRSHVERMAQMFESSKGC